MVRVTGQDREAGQRRRTEPQSELRSLEALAARVQELRLSRRTDIRDDQVLEDHVEERHVEGQLAIEPAGLQPDFAAAGPLGVQDLRVFGLGQVGRRRLEGGLRGHIEVRFVQRARPVLDQAPQRRNAAGPLPVGTGIARDVGLGITHLLALRE